ncbi:hypothetical protein V474_12960 [Novosphingobium barchaimii LL02]|uniref:Uncharacterized protein n=1 Tax=Novosphingobium barchaimii LL02 TaxID=1114963 RepID=A0A0J8AXJ9_9SPHN|nr:hypothetical protein [Novosphingobium barchaimii]KMS58930.1 hypothetical protein V474_12960 [Novosphingobium barchaimii LL02]
MAFARPAMVGAIVLARAVYDIAFADEVLRETRAWIGGVSPTANVQKSEGNLFV